MTENELIEVLKTKSSPIIIEWTNSRKDIVKKSFEFRMVFGRPSLYYNDIEEILGRINSKYCKGMIL